MSGIAIRKKHAIRLVVEHLPSVRMCWGPAHVPELQEVGLGQGACAVLVQLSEEKEYIHI